MVLHFRRPETRAQAIRRLSRPWPHAVIHAGDGDWIGPHDTPGRRTRRQDDLIALITEYGLDFRNVAAVAYLPGAPPQLGFSVYLRGADGKPVIKAREDGQLAPVTYDVARDLIGALPTWWRPER